MRKRIQQFFCRHRWRPCIVGREEHAAKTCGKCDKVLLMSDAEFYAVFGRIPRIGAC